MCGRLETGPKASFAVGLGYEALWPISDLSPYQLDPVIHLFEAEMSALALNVTPAGACSEHVC
jgi:hypothetical protein